jgi:hypothetical protein
MPEAFMGGESPTALRVRYVWCVPVVPVQQFEKPLSRQPQQYQLRSRQACHLHQCLIMKYDSTVLETRVRSLMFSERFIIYVLSTS